MSKLGGSQHPYFLIVVAERTGPAAGLVQPPASAIRTQTLLLLESSRHYSAWRVRHNQVRTPALVYQGSLPGVTGAPKTVLHAYIAEGINRIAPGQGFGRDEAAVAGCGVPGKASVAVECQIAHPGERAGKIRWLSYNLPGHVE